VELTCRVERNVVSTIHILPLRVRAEYAAKDVRVFRNIA
jgi:hypothetical protein